jgi:hypothetical protein
MGIALVERGILIAILFLLQVILRGQAAAGRPDSSARRREHVIATGDIDKLERQW